MRASLKLLSDAAKVNEFGIRQLPEGLRRALFSREEPVIDPRDVECSREELRKFSLLSDGEEQKTRSQKPLPHVILPQLCGDVETHFMEIGRRQVAPYLELIQQLIAAPKTPPPPPSNWRLWPGWLRYSPDGRSAEPVDAPLEAAMCFDIEVCVRDGDHPTLAVAVTPDAWYGWCSRHLVDQTVPDGALEEDDLIKLRGSDVDLKEPRLVVGHNVSYDRARVAEEYRLAKNGTRFLDTMALHIAASGMTSGQRMMKQKQNQQADENLDEVIRPKWLSETSLNNLKDVYQLYCGNSRPLEKQKRDIFVTGSLEDIRKDFNNLMGYCADDVRATLELTTKMSVPLLPISRDRWDHYVRQADDLSEETERDTEKVLGRLAKEACQLMENEMYRDDLWMWDQDWSVRGLKMKKVSPSQKRKTNAIEAPLKEDDKEFLEHKFYTLFSTYESGLYKTQPRYPGYPKWFRDLHPSESRNAIFSPEVTGLTPVKKLAPKLLRLSWLGYPLHRHDTEKWGYLVPTDDGDPDAFAAVEGDSDELQSSTFPTHTLLAKMRKNELADVGLAEGVAGENAAFVTEPPDYFGSSKKKKVGLASGEGLRLTPHCVFHRLPHKDGKNNNVGNPLAKDFMEKIKDGILATESGGLADKVLKAAKSVSYWKSNQDRIRGQLLVHMPGEPCSVIVPQLVTAGTLTRRAVERTWLTASNAKPDRIGSELKTLVQAPNGHSLVGADVDSQELWIAAVLGDAGTKGKRHGSTPFGWMTLQGSKSSGTDMHSMTARTVGVSRDDAKVLNYGRIYGAGVTFAKQLLQRFNPKLSDVEARRLAVQMYTQTKGDRTYVLKKLGAFCYAGAFKLKDPDHLQGMTVSKAEMSSMVKFKRKLETLFTQRSGDKAWVVKPEAESLLIELGYDVFEGELVSSEVIFEVCQQVGTGHNRHGTTEWSNDVQALSSRSPWHGGTESHSFNRLEEIALDFVGAKTPVLGCRISRPLDAKVVGRDYLPSRVNWVVQSSAVDYLHLLLSAMSWLMDETGIGGRFAISIHDEVRYLVRSEDAERMALALQISNLLVRSMFCSRLGMADLPESVAYFSGVDIDRIMRKDPQSECITPSNPQGLLHGHGIEPGRTMTIGEIIQEVGPRLL